MIRTRPTPTILARCVTSGIAALTALTLAGCSGTADGIATSEVSQTETQSAEPATSATDSADTADTPTTPTTMPTTTASNADVTDLGAVGTLESSEVHEISVTFDDSDYDAMIATYSSTGDKEWIEATVTIDGQTYEQVGIRLKGNSSLRSISGGGGGQGPSSSASADDPTTLPWLIQLDKFVEDQHHDGLTDLVVRSNSSSTSLNEAVALELLDLAGLASQDAIAASFTVNGSEPTLRLVIDNPDDSWMAEEFDAGGALYKAESTGDYSYRGDDPESYVDVFDQEAGTENTDLTPLIELLDFINNSDDATFEAELADRLDVDAFATYLAMQELLNNFDDIDGPGNNSYLYYDAASGRFTVVPWDHNLAFGLSPGGAGGGGGDRPAPGDLGADFGGGGGGQGGGFGGRSNILVQRFLAVDGWQSLYDDRLAELRADLYDSGAADTALAQWTAIVASSGLVDDGTISSEADQIAQQFS